MVNNNFINQFFIEDNLNYLFKEHNKYKINKIKNQFDDNIYTIENLLSLNEINFLIEKSKIDQAVGIDGILKNYKKNDHIGSYRGSLYHEELANILYSRINSIYPKRKDFINSNTDHDNSNDWKFSGINPLFRFIRYSKSGFLIPHYDSPYIINDEERTLVTLVIYLTDNNDGATRFIKDPQLKKEFNERDFSDQLFSPSIHDIEFSIKPKKGNALIFDHRLLHDSESISNDDKIIIRTDLIFKRDFNEKT